MYAPLQERVLFLGDWWHTSGAALAMRLNRPFDGNRTTPTSGAWAWVNNPQVGSGALLRRQAGGISRWSGAGVPGSGPRPLTRARMPHPPQALLINGRGFYGDCNLNAGGVTTPINCTVNQYWVPPGASAVQPWASAVNPGAARCTPHGLDAGVRRWSLPGAAWGGAAAQPPAVTCCHAAASAAGCSHTNVTVEYGKTYLLRIINAASLTYQVAAGGR